MQRYFIPLDNWQHDIVFIKDDDAHHLLRVMRSKIGDQVICNHPNGNAAICTIKTFENDVVQLSVDQWLNKNAELPLNITIAQGIPKGDKLDFVLQKGTELGAFSFIPLQCERSVVKWNHKKYENKLRRFSKIVKEASEQSHRNRIPAITRPMGVDELIQESKPFDIKLFAHEEEAKVDKFHSFSTIVKNLKKGQNVVVCIGPEGGFTIEEAKLLKESGFQPVRLGPRILRTETASLYVLASISYHFEELGCL